MADVAATGVRGSGNEGLTKNNIEIQFQRHFDLSEIFFNVIPPQPANPSRNQSHTSILGCSRS
jgi:hypothetical protein